MILAVAWPKLHPAPIFGSLLSGRLALSANSFRYSFYRSKLSFNSTALKCHCSQDKSTQKHAQGFSVLTSDIPWKTGSLWTTMAVYMFNLHIPLGFGGLSIVAYILHQPVLDPQTQSLSLLLLDILELVLTLLLLKRAIKPEQRLMHFFKFRELSTERNWVLASAMGFGILIMLVFLTSILADRLYGVKDVNNPILKEMLLSSDISKVACVTVYCIITPLLEEMVYRGFLLVSLVSAMKWQEAVVLSAAIFSAAHFSVYTAHDRKNTLELFYIYKPLDKLSYFRPPSIMHSPVGRYG